MGSCCVKLFWSILFCRIITKDTDIIPPPSTPAKESEIPSFSKLRVKIESEPCSQGEIKTEPYDDDFVHID